MQLVLREQEQRTRQAAVVYFLSSIGTIPTTTVQRGALFLEGGGAHSMLSSKMTGIIVIMIRTKDTVRQTRLLFFRWKIKKDWRRLRVW